MTKQVLVIRKDLNMRKGKIAAQAAHASMKVFFDRIIKPIENHLTIDGVKKYCVEIGMVDEDEKAWIEGIFTKVCVSVDSEQELLSVYEQAKASGLPCSLIQDAGLTEFGGVPTHTAVAVGPATAEKIDKITGSLKLL